MGKYKAKVSFAGEVCMGVGEVRELDSSLAEPLLKCGYIEVMENESKRNNNNGNVRSDSGNAGKSGRRGRKATGSNESGSS